MLFLILAAAIGLGHSKVINVGISEPDQQWVPVANFVYESEGGVFKFTVDANELYNGEKIALYHDIPEEGFESIYKAQVSCEKKLSKAAKTYDLTRVQRTGEQEIIKKDDLEDGKVPVGGKVLANGDVLTTNVTMTVTVSNTGPRFWWVVVANCEVPGKPFNGVEVNSFKITFLNAGGKFKSQFSWSAQGIFENCIFTLIALLVLLALTGVQWYRFKTLEKASPAQAMKYLFIIEFIHFIDACIMTAHYDIYSEDGVGMPTSLNTTIFMTVVVQTLLLAMFLNLAKGLWINERAYRDQSVIVEVLIGYLILVVVLLVGEYSEKEHVDPTETYVYLSDAGIAVGVIRLALAVYFTLCMRETMSAEQASAGEGKSALYCAMTFTGFLWMASLLLLIAIAFGVDAVDRKKIVVICEELFTLCAYFGLFAFFYVNGTYHHDDETRGKHAAVPPEFGTEAYSDREEAV